LSGSGRDAAGSRAYKGAATSRLKTEAAASREYENAHIVLWIIKDLSWCCGWHVLGITMILPTLIVAVDIARRSRDDRTELSHNLAVCFWICANAVWMTGEFFFNDAWRPGARVFFGAGTAALAWHYVPLLFRRCGQAA
jgi:hypothetical protein